MFGVFAIHVVLAVLVIGIILPGRRKKT